MSQTIAVELIKAVPGILWVAFAALVYLSLRNAIIPQIGRLHSVKTPMIEFGFAEQLLVEAAARSEASAPPSVSEQRAAVCRLQHAAEILKGGRILWVDDNPEWNLPLIQLFRQLGMTVDTSHSTDEAMSHLGSRSYDLILSDMRRDTERPAESAGITLLDALGRRGVRSPVIIASAGFDPQIGVHPGIVAYTNGVDDIVHHVIDVMERIKFGTAL
ncbi:response regulator [Micromonospora chalcea]|uniref:response regulator n=1 Tax=Micromonospora chalcea TaxID=1874 RepID=UPI00157D65AC|nr:response regulator [Micromonospora chalcea]